MKSEEKVQLRSHILNQIKSLDSEQKSQKSKSIQTHLQSLLKNQKGYWAGYQSLADEPAIDWKNISGQIQWCFPFVQGDVLKFKNSNVNFKASTLGVREPLDGEEVPLANIQGLVIPGVAFSKMGHRLGRGRGFFDRTLEKYLGKKIGICYEMSLCDQLPHEAHDVQCSPIVTENSIYQTGSEGDSKWN
ncbi:MAG: 5-formyltetrahydrofolate cyclo-ligase [Bdellovibrio sp.]|nr:5-formyltetrahydrofolate cyclo-ligase [Bdellovibrio sp.]